MGEKVQRVVTEKRGGVNGHFKKTCVNMQKKRLEKVRKKMRQMQ